MNYSQIYTSLDDVQIYKDIKTCLNIVHKINILFNFQDNKQDMLIKYVTNTNEYLLIYNKLSAYVQLELYENALTPLASNLSKKLTKINTIFLKISIKFSELCSKIDNLLEIIDSSNILSQYKYQILKFSNPLFWETKLASNTTYELFYKFLLSSVSIDYNEIGEDACKCLITIKKEATNFAKSKHFNSVLELELLKNNLNINIFFNIINTIEHLSTLFEKYIVHRQNKKNNSKIKYSELFNPITTNKYSLNYIKDYIISAFSDNCLELGSLAKSILCSHTLYVDPNSNINSCHIKLFFNKSSEIVIKPTNTISDLFIISHELGHAFQSKLLMGNNRPLNCSLSPAFEELGAMYCENIIVTYTLNKYPHSKLCEDVLAAYIAHFFEATLDVYVRFLFEKDIFDNINSPFSCEHLSTLIENIQRKVYNNYIIPNPYLWISKPHFYSTSISYYNFPYAFAILFALSLTDKCLKEILIESGKIDYKNIKSKLDIDLENEQCFNNAVKKIDYYITLFTSM